MSQFSIELTKSCRTCLKLNLTEELLQPIYNQTIILSPVCEFIFQQLNILKEDGLPQQICKECFSYLTSIRKFWFKCKDSQKILVKLVGQAPLSPKIFPKLKSNSSLTLTSHLLSQSFELKNESTSTNISNFNCNESTDYNYDSIECISINSDLKNIDDIAVDDEDDVVVDDDADACNEEKLAADYEDDVDDDYDVVDDDNVDVGNECNEENLKFECQICNKYFEMENVLIQHILIEHKEIMHSTFKSNVSIKCLNKNLKKIKETYGNKGTGSNWKICDCGCETCDNYNMGFPNVVEKIKQTQTEYRSNLIKCTCCNIKFLNLHEFKAHNKSVHAVGNNKCLECGKMFSLKSHLYKHIMRIHKIADNICDQCGLTFTNKDKYEYHLRSHDPSKRYKCQYCDKSFLQGHHKLHHERTHTGERPFLCTVCGKGFRTASFLRLHMYTHNRNHPYSCQYCNRRFVLPGEYRKHSEIHVGENQYKCDLCDEHKNSFMDLKYHKYYMHNGPNPHQRVTVAAHLIHTNGLKLSVGEDTVYFPCLTCGKKFRLQSFLKEHMRIHVDTESRAFVCDKCDFKFKRLADLRLHFNAVHLKLKPYKCKECGNCYAQSGTLSEHMRIHTGARPYKCNICYRDFRYNHQYKTHLREHYGETSYRCDHCNISFKYSAALKAHLLHHGCDNVEM